VDARDAKARRQAEAVDSRAAYDRIRGELPTHLVRRFDQLRAHCQKLTDLAGSMRGPAVTGLDRAAVESLERLLWEHLRMIWNAAKL